MFLLLASYQEAAAQDEGLTFKYPPEVIQAKAKQGQFLPVNMVTEPVSFATFNAMYLKFVQTKKAGIYIGVVVDSNNPNWPDEQTTAHILNVQKHIKLMMEGDKEKKMSGFAELYGARIVAIVPITHDPQNRKPHGYRDEKGEYVETALPVNVDDIILLVNDHKPKTKKNGAFINTTAELESALEGKLKEGAHKLTNAQYIKQLEAELAAKKQRIKALEKDNQRLEREQKEIDQLIKELPYLNDP